MSPLEVMETWFRRVWFEADASAIDEIFVPTGLARGLGASPLAGPVEFRVFQQALLRQIRAVRIVVDRSTTEGEWVWMWCTLSAESAATGAPVQITGVCLARVRDDHILEAYNQWDFLTLWEQLGVVQDGAFARSLGAAPAR